MKRNNLSDRARAWGKKWADHNHPSLDDDPDASQMLKAIRCGEWVGFFSGGCKGWWHGYQAALRDMRRR